MPADIRSEATSSAPQDATPPSAPVVNTSGLYQWLYLYQPLIALSALIGVALFWWYRAPAPAAMAIGLGLVVLPLTAYGHLALRSGDVERAVLAISAGLWMTSLLAALLGPVFFACSLMVSVGGIIIAVPYTQASSVRRAVVCSAALAVVAACLSLTEPVFSYEPIPEMAARFIAAAYAVVILLLYAQVAWHASAQIQDVLRGLLTANRALRESERSLEQKVAERTAGLERSERSLALARDEALAANRTKSDFLASMSHELRTPLNAVIGYSQMLQEEAEDAGHEQYVPDLARIITSGHHLLRLINDVLDLAKIEADRIELLAEPIVVAELLQEMAATIAPLIESNNNTLVVQTGTVGSIHSDIVRIRQILLNLLSNAAKFTSAGTITLSARRMQIGGADWIALAVADTGIGMTPDQLEHVFEAFSQADASTTRDYGGTGLGLAIVERFCTMLGGRIEAVSKTDAGSTFTAFLPAKMPAQTPVDSPPPTAEADTDRHPNDDGLARVLVVDDDPSARDMLERLLAAAGYAVRCVANADTCMRVAHQWHPHVITLDVVMPDVDGWSVLSRLKADHLLADTPVILITMLNDSNLGYSLGAAEYLRKPVDRAALTRMLARYTPGDTAARVLVVDDDEPTRELLCRDIERAGLECVHAEDGAAALVRIGEHRPAVVLLDLMMPNMDGFAFIKALRSHPEWHSIPVVVITAKDLSRDEWQLLNSTADRIVQKGQYSATGLLADIQRHLPASRSAANPVTPSPEINASERVLSTRC